MTGEWFMAGKAVGNYSKLISWTNVGIIKRVDKEVSDFLPDATWSDTAGA
jgi:hypothetical protein